MKKTILAIILFLSVNAFSQLSNGKDAFQYFDNQKANYGGVTANKLKVQKGDCLLSYGFRNEDWYLNHKTCKIFQLTTDTMIVGDSLMALKLLAGSFLDYKSYSESEITKLNGIIKYLRSENEKLLFRLYPQTAKK